jgi:hypothetical protein
MTVTPEKIAVALGRAAPLAESVTAQQWQMWIDDAVMLIETRRAELGKPEPDEAKLDYVVREAVVAHVKRPEDATQVTVTVDDATSSRTYQSGKGRVTILDEWWVLLGLVPASGAFSIDTVGVRSSHVPWCSQSLVGAYCSCGEDIAGEPIFGGDE